jgi:hypothetical protein
MRSDAATERDVKDELTSDPDIDATNIATAVKDGVVTLTGSVRSFRQRRRTRRQARHWRSRRGEQHRGAFALHSPSLGCRHCPRRRGGD